MGLNNAPAALAVNDAKPRPYPCPVLRMVAVVVPTGGAGDGAGDAGRVFHFEHVLRRDCLPRVKIAKQMQQT